MKEHTKIKSVAAIVISIAVTTLCAEVVFRFYEKHHHYTQFDRKLGWRTRPFFKIDSQFRDISGREYCVSYSTKERGFREFGDVKSRRKKILFLGDSITMACDVSDSKTFYHMVGESLGFEVFAYGCGGYGTLQEFMILDEVADIISPDFLLLQLSVTDFVDNSIELEKATRCNIVYPRPFLLDNGVISYDMPNGISPFRNLINGRLELLSFVMSRIDRLTIQPDFAILEEIKKRGRTHQAFQRAVRTTDILVGNIKRRCPRANVLFFCSESESPFHEELLKIARKHGIRFIEGVPQAISVQQKFGTPTRASDGTHWNEEGYRLCADVIISYFKETQLLGY